MPPKKGAAQAAPTTVKITHELGFGLPPLTTAIGQRIHWIEFHEQDYFPVAWRNFVTDVLAFGWQIDPFAALPASLAKQAKAVQRTFPMLKPPARHIADLLHNALRRSGGEPIIVDLCSGGSGPIPRVSRILQQLTKNDEAPVRFVLTDLHPNIPAFEYASAQDKNITFYREPVNAVACNVKGFRTIFGSFHHFQPEMARAILQDAVDKNQGIAIFEMTGRTLALLSFIALVPVLLAVLAAPLMKPFSFSRLFFTWIVPVVPFFLVLDGFTSCLRTYSPTESEELIRSLKGTERLQWQIGRRPVLLPFVHMSYIIGVPVNADKTSTGKTA